MKTTMKGERVFQDGSGAPAVIYYKSFVFSFDFLGELKGHRIDTGRCGRIELKIAQDVCTKVYSEWLSANVTDEWKLLNRAMYAAQVAL